MCEERCEAAGESEEAERIGRDLVDIERSGAKITDLETVLKCLSDPTRRVVLYQLRENEVLDGEELAARVGAWEQNVSPEAVADEDRERILTHLFHVHLPKLADANLIEYDRRSKTARYTEPPAHLERLLDSIEQLEAEPAE